MPPPLFSFDTLAGATLPTYHTHETVEDAQGVIAPWYQGLNGQLDERVNIAVNVYKRYPWVDEPKAVMAAPDFIYNSHWSIKPDGTIVIPPTTDRWAKWVRRVAGLMLLCSARWFYGLPGLGCP